MQTLLNTDQMDPWGPQCLTAGTPQPRRDNEASEWQEELNVLEEPGNNLEDSEPGSEPEQDPLESDNDLPSSKHPKCQGILVQWTPGSVWDTYPFHCHETCTFPWELIRISNHNWLCLRSTSC